MEFLSLLVLRFFYGENFAMKSVLRSPLQLTLTISSRQHPNRNLFAQKRFNVPSNPKRINKYVYICTTH